MKLYIYDEEFIFLKEYYATDIYAPVPSRSTSIAPPPLEGEQVAKWQGGSWIVLPSRPVPEPDPEPAIEVPEAVTMRQARLALLGAGKLEMVDAAIDSLDEPMRTAAMIEWEYSQEVHRNKEFVKMLAPALGLTEEELDQLFIIAATL